MRRPFGQRGQLQLEHRGPQVSAEGGFQSGRPGVRFWPPGEKYQQRPLPGETAQSLSQPERSGVCPMEVFKDEQSRAVRPETGKKVFNC